MLMTPLAGGYGSTTTTATAANVYYYYNDHWQILCEYTAETTCRQWFSYGNYIDEVLSRNTHPTDMQMAQYYAHDHLYSPAALVSFDGAAVQERYEYDAYGKATITARGADNAWYTADDVTLTASAYHNPFTFTGRQLDSFDDDQLRLMFSGDRYYSYAIGRWINLYSSDAPGQTINAYFYHLNMQHAPGEPTSVLLAVLGTTHCDITTGKPVVNVYNKTVTAPCTQQHEDRHARQIKTACANYAKKRSTMTPAQQKAADKQWAEWMNANRKVFECSAYKDSLRCGDDLKRNSKFGCVGGMSLKDFTIVEDYIKNAKDQIAKNCTGTGGSYTPSPF